MTGGEETALWTWRNLVAASGGAADGTPAAAIAGISIDTRSLAPGEAFVALTDARDGHMFVPAAFKAGAAAAIVARDYVRQPGDGALLRVGDPLKALERIGNAARWRLPSAARVVAVTGSAGKTGTKEMLRACLSRIGPTHAPEKSFNNHWGVPLTLARMPAATRFAVVEIGMNHSGEIRPLVKLARPHLAIVTNVLPVHVGNFPDGEVGVASAKAEIVEGLEPGGTAILPFDNPHFARLVDAAAACRTRVVSFGSGAGADVRAERMTASVGGSEVTARVAGRPVTFRIGTPGAHIAANALAVLAALETLGADLDMVLPALAEVGPPPGRGARTTLAAPGGEILLIDESYNANPASMAAAIATAAAHCAGDHRLVLVLGDMLELGPGAADYHRGLGPAIAAAGAGRVFACGPNMRLLFDDLPAERRGAWAPAAAELATGVLATLRAGDVVMVKGSLGSRMAPIVEAIRSRFAARPGEG
jgi:UDP-N-acetylmuramoyl-tripeptide--D-alanyl-D-alanine ligase